MCVPLPRVSLSVLFRQASKAARLQKFWQDKQANCHELHIENKTRSLSRSINSLCLLRKAEQREWNYEYEFGFTSHAKPSWNNHIANQSELLWERTSVKRVYIICKHLIKDWLVLYNCRERENRKELNANEFFSGVSAILSPITFTSAHISSDFCIVFPPKSRYYTQPVTAQGSLNHSSEV